MKTNIYLIISTLLMAAIPAKSAVATSGTLTIDSDTTLKEAHFGVVLIDADGVTLDCDGHTVAGSGELGGIFIRRRTDVTVRNCRVTGFDRAFLIDRSSNVELSGNYATQNQWGYWISFSHDVLAEGNTAEDNRQSGFYLGSSTDNVIRDNQSASNGMSGFSLHDSDGNSLIQNISESNEVAGFFIDFSHSNLLESNDAHDNVSGFSLLNSSSNTLIANEASGNSGPGYRFAEVDLVYVADNEAINNGEDSYRIEGLTSIFEAPIRDSGGDTDADQEAQLSPVILDSSQNPDGETSASQTLPPIRQEIIGLLLVLAAVIALLILSRPGRAWAILQRGSGAGGTALFEATGGLAEQAEVPVDRAIPDDERESPILITASVPDVEDALRHLHNLAHLGTHRLSRLRLVQRRVPLGIAMTHVDLGRITQQVLWEAVDKFKPEGPRPVRGSPPEWHQFLILHESYVNRRLNREVMADLHIGEGTFNRRRREAVRALTRLLDEWDQAEANGPMRPIAF